MRSTDRPPRPVGVAGLDAPIEAAPPMPPRPQRPAPAGSHPVRDLLGRGRVLAGRARTAAHRVAALIAPEVEGFRRHGWSGKLFLLTHGLGTAGWTLGSLRFMYQASDFSAGWIGVVYKAIAGGVLFLLSLLYWRMLRGVARFRLGARDAAIVLLALRTLPALGLLADDLPVAAKLFLGVDLALSVQFIAYFLRTRPLYEEGKACEPLTRGGTI